MAASPALPGLFLCFAACVLLVFVSVSSPTWEKIFFLKAGQTHYGVFGFTGSKIHIGYELNPGILNFDNTKLNAGVIRNLTKVLILHPIAAGLAGLSVLFGLCGAGYHRVGTILMTLLAGLATIVTLVAFVIDMVLFGIARNRFRDQGIDAQYGNACWLTLGAMVALLMGFCASACGSLGSYRRSRKETY